MRNGAVACIVFLLAGCADYDFSSRLSILDAKRDGPGLPKYLDKRQTIVRVNGTQTDLINAYRDAMLMLDCAKIVENKDAVRGDRKFVWGFACGVGGETLHVTTEELKENHYSVRVVSYKRFPYPAATRFLDRDFCDILVQILPDPNRDPVF
jgi:hypothetical protein